MPRKNYTRKIKRNKNGGKRPQSNPKSIKKHKNMIVHSYSFIIYKPFSFRIFLS